MYQEVRPTMRAGDYVRCQDGVWRVEYVNECRAYLRPVRGNKVTIRDDDGNVIRDFTAKGRGISIGPTSLVEVLTDYDPAKDTEAAGGPTGAAVPPAASQPPAAERAPLAAAARPVTATPAAGWYATGTQATTFRPGSLAAEVMAHIEAHPGCATSAIVAALAGLQLGNVASCVSRFNQGGLIAKR